MCATDTGSVENVLPKKMKIDSHFEFEFHFISKKKKEIRSNVIGLQ
jgi:hypothetical protein